MEQVPFNKMTTLLRPHHRPLGRRAYSTSKGTANMHFLCSGIVFLVRNLTLHYCFAASFYFNLSRDWTDDPALGLQSICGDCMEQEDVLCECCISTSPKT